MKAWKTIHRRTQCKGKQLSSVFYTSVDSMNCEIFVAIEIHVHYE